MDQEVKDFLKRLETSQDQILAAIQGDNLGNKGLLQRTSSLEATQQQHDQKIDTLNKKVISFAGVATGLMIAFELYHTFIAK